MGISSLCTNYGAQYLVLTVGDKREKHLVFEKIMALFCKVGFLVVEIGPIDRQRIAAALEAEHAQ